MLAAGSEIGQGKVLFLEPDLRTAQAAAYAAVECIQFDGAHFRPETPKPFLVRPLIRDFIGPKVVGYLTQW